MLVCQIHKLHLFTINCFKYAVCLCEISKVNCFRHNTIPELGKRLGLKELEINWIHMIDRGVAKCN